MSNDRHSSKYFEEAIVLDQSTWIREAVVKVFPYGMRYRMYRGAK